MSSQFRQKRSLYASRNTRPLLADGAAPPLLGKDLLEVIIFAVLRLTRLERHHSYHIAASPRRACVPLARIDGSLYGR